MKKLIECIALQIEEGKIATGYTTNPNATPKGSKTTKSNLKGTKPAAAYDNNVHIPGFGMVSKDWARRNGYEEHIKEEVEELDENLSNLRSLAAKKRALRAQAKKDPANPALQYQLQAQELAVRKEKQGLLFKNLGDKIKKVVKESDEMNEGTDHIKMSIPLFIRCLEWAHETAKDDVDLHIFAENAISQNRCLSTEDYDSLLPNKSEE